MLGTRTESPPRPTILRGRAAGPPKIRRDPGAIPAGSLGGKPRADEPADATPPPPKFSEKNTARSWMYAPGRSNTKKEGDLRGEGWGCYRVKKKEETLLGTQTEKKG